MKPSLGRIVIVKGFESNGTDEQAAIITRVWSDQDPADGEPVCVNLVVFPDCAQARLAGGESAPGFGAISRSSVKFYESRQAALDALATLNYKPTVAYWPPKV
jgi:hypothetical protein